MLRRAERLQFFFNVFCMLYDCCHLKLDPDEWRQVDYLVNITQPFFKYVTLLSKISDSTIHLVYPVYNKLCDHLEKSIQQLSRKKINWKRSMLPALFSSRKMLREYHSKTEESEIGNLYRIGTILAPQNKTELFQTREWQGNDGAEYQKSLEDRLRGYQSFTRSSQPHTEKTKVSGKASELDLMFLEESSGLGLQSEVAQYLHRLRGQYIFNLPSVKRFPLN